MSEKTSTPCPLDLISVLQEYPTLSANGMDAKEYCEIDFVQFRKAFEWLENHRTRNHSKGRHEFYSSYYLKHVAEDAAGAYISNGALIAAGFLQGLKWEHDQGSPNVYFKVPPVRS
jgi:hypothetical protein